MDPLDPDEVLGFAIVRAHHLVARRFHDVLAQVSLTPTQFGVLTSLARNPDMTQGALARAVLMTPQSLGEMLRGLVSRGLVSRQDGVGRGHGIHVAITATGAELLDRATPLIVEMNHPDRFGLTGVEADRLLRLLCKVLTTAPDPRDTGATRGKS